MASGPNCRIRGPACCHRTAIAVVAHSRSRCCWQPAWGPVDVPLVKGFIVTQSGRLVVLLLLHVRCWPRAIYQGDVEGPAKLQAGLPKSEVRRLASSAWLRTSENLEVTRGSKRQEVWSGRAEQSLARSLGGRPCPGRVAAPPTTSRRCVGGFFQWQRRAVAFAGVYAPGPGVA